MSGRGFYEPQAGPRIIRVVSAHASEVVRIVWTLPDGTHTEDHTCPPPEVIDAARRTARDDEGKG